MAGKMVLYKLVVLGDGGVGKTAMTIQLTLNHFVETCDPTIEDSYRKQVVIDGQSCMLEVLDTAGQEEYTALRDQWIRDGEGFVLVYSICSRSSFTRVQRFHNQVQRVKEASFTGPGDTGSPISATLPLVSAPICLIGNKCDRVEEREVSTQEGHALARQLGCEFVESSAKNCINVEKAFYDVVRQLRRQRGVALSTHRSKGLRSYRSKQSWWRRGISISISPSEGATEEGKKKLTSSLVQAAKSNRERDVIAYIDAGASVNVQSGSDGAAIHAASVSGHANIVNILLKKGATINARSPSGTSPLQMAAAEGHLAVVRLLLHKGAQINQTSQLHGTALSAAASRGRLSVVKLLLKKGADVNLSGGPYGNALQAAAWAGKSAIVEALVGEGADINARGHGDCTALQIAAFAGHTSVIKTLLELGGRININAPGGKYGCALKAADDGGHFEAVMVLLEAGAERTLTATDAPGNSGETNDEEVEAVESTEETIISDQIVADAVTSPAASSGWPFTASTANLLSPPTPAASSGWPFTANTPNLLSPLSPIILSDAHQTSIPSPSERPRVHPVGFSTVANPNDATIDIVFVHGLQGHPENTWTHQQHVPKRRFFRSSSPKMAQQSQSGVFWPYDLLSKHPDFSRARILTWGYDSKIIAEFFGSSDQQNISQHGNDLMVALQQERKRDQSRPLVFVAHSLGGILVKVALDNSKRSTHQPQYLPIYASTKAIIFLGTPHGGSMSTNWGVLASNLTKFALQGPSEKIIKGLKPNNELLENLKKAFLQMLEDNHFRIHTFYETKPMLGIYGLNDRVVPYDSAVVGHARQEVVRGINGNHSEICKFEGESDPGYKAVLGVLEDFVLEAAGDQTGVQVSTSP